jgi:hypothetical protein
VEAEMFQSKVDSGQLLVKDSIVTSTGLMNSIKSSAGKRLYKDMASIRN